MSDLPPIPSNNLILNAWRSFCFCMHKDNYARFKGRAGRFEYWSMTIIGTVLSFVPFLLFPILGYLFIIILLGLLIYLAMPMLAVFVRRLHDTNFSAWWIVLYYGLFSVLFTWGIFWLMPFLLLHGCDFENVDTHILRLYNVSFQILSFLIDILSVFLFVLTLLPGTKGVNKYGESV